MMNYEKIPQEMKDLKRWVLWKKKDKIPLNAKTGYGAKSNDDSTWATFDEAIKQKDFYGCDGVGFMLGSGYFGVDIDDVIGKNEEVIKDIVGTLKSYTEISQSGTGIHIICKGILPLGARRKGNVEMYDSNRYFALTGNIYNYTNDNGEVENFTEVKTKTEEIKPLWEKYLNNKNKYVYQEENRSNVLKPTILTNQQVIDKASESSNGNLFTCLYYGQWEGIYKSQSEADASLCSMLAFWCGKNPKQMDEIFRSSKLYREKWNSKRGEKTYGQIVINGAISICKDVYSSNYNNNNKSVVYDPMSGSTYTKKDYDLSDTGNAQRFIDRFGNNVRYNFDNKNWVIWDGKTWLVDRTQLIKKMCDLMIDEMKEEAIKIADDDLASALMGNIKHLSSNSGKEAMLKEAMHIGDTATINASYDKDKFILNCPNGVVDLKTGRIVEHNRLFMCSKNTNINCDLENEPKLWIKSINEIFLGDKELIKFFQKALGYSLCGSTKEQCLFECYGNGSNGKSMTLNIIYSMLGDYALNIQIESILTKSGNNVNSDIARMNGARFIRTTEPNEGVRFNEGLIKQLVGGDVITARFLYGKEFEFFPNFKLWIACNNKIAVRGTDFGIWRRMRLIPFLAKFDGENNDKSLEQKLMKELPQILGWAVKGCLMWVNEGLEPPKIVSNATKEYEQEMDVVATFCKDCLKEKINGKEKAGDVFKAYKQWAFNGNEYCMSQTKFGVEMGKKYRKNVICGYTYYNGIILKEHDTSYVYEEKTND